MRSGRLLSMLMLLQVRGRVPASELARSFEVSVRTIYRDVDELSASGVPVYAERGRSGGIALQAGYRTKLTGLTPREAETLPLGKVAGAARALGFGAEADAAQLKLMASLPPEASRGAQHVAARFHFDAIPWYHRPESPPCLAELAGAVWRDRRVRVSYESWRGSVRRSLDPLGLVLKGGLWYLVAQSRGHLRSYRVSGIRELVVLDRGFRRPARFALAEHWPSAVAQFEARLMREAATVRLSEEGCRILRAVSPAAAERVAATQRPDRRRGWVLAELPIESPEYSARQLLRLGAEVEVLAPAALRTALRREAGSVVRLYARQRGASASRRAA